MYDEDLQIINVNLPVVKSIGKFKTIPNKSNIFSAISSNNTARVEKYR